MRARDLPVRQGPQRAVARPPRHRPRADARDERGDSATAKKAFGAGFHGTPQRSGVALNAASASARSDDLVIRPSRRTSACSPAEVLHSMPERPLMRSPLLRLTMRNRARRRLAHRPKRTCFSYLLFDGEFLEPLDANWAYEDAKLPRSRRAAGILPGLTSATPTRTARCVAFGEPVPSRRARRPAGAPVAIDPAPGEAAAPALALDELADELEAACGAPSTAISTR